MADEEQVEIARAMKEFVRPYCLPVYLPRLSDGPTGGALVAQIEAMMVLDAPQPGERTIQIRKDRHAQA
jgi:hypothetical protein